MGLFFSKTVHYGRFQTGSCWTTKTSKHSSITANKKGYNPVLFRATEETNEKQAIRVVSMAEKLLGSISDKRVAVLGLAFKKDTDDIREAASLRVIESLKKKGAQVVAYDPMAIPKAERVFSKQIDYA